MLTLGIDTSCDDTSVAFLDDEQVLVNLSANQDDFHARYGGVVPEISARKHLEMIIPLFKHLLDEAHIQQGSIDLIAVTRGPGLIGGLLVGVTFANTLAGTLGTDIVGVHHLEGHLFSPGIGQATLPERHLALIISGGHTRLIAVDGLFNYSAVGSTRDDAAGELIDKTGRLLGFPYPGGKAMDDAVMEFSGDAVEFPRPMIHSDNYDFSFSGLKTAALYHIRSCADTGVNAGAVAKGIMGSLADVLAAKCFRACETLGFDTLTVSGGVSASRFLRAYLTRVASAKGIEIRFPLPQYSTDNAAMIATAGRARFIAGRVSKDHIGCAASVGLV